MLAGRRRAVIGRTPPGGVPVAGFSCARASQSWCSPPCSAGSSPRAS